MTQIAATSEPWQSAGAIAASTGVDEEVVRRFRLLLEYAENRDEFERCHARCVRWTKAHGIGVWREGHASDMQKLYDRREARRVTRIIGGWLLEHPAGTA